MTGWIPFRVRPGPRPMVDWCYLGQERFVAPFFSDTIERCLRQPFNQLFLRQAPIETLVERYRTHPGLEPTAFIFHGSRCGSTLMAQLAAALPETIAISEAPPVDPVAPEFVRDHRRLRREADAHRPRGPDHERRPRGRDAAGAHVRAGAIAQRRVPRDPGERRPAPGEL